MKRAAKPAAGKAALNSAPGVQRRQAPSVTPSPVVAIGASAGGLEAVSELLRALPSRTGMAIVVIQHLDPHHESILHKLLGKATEMPVREAEHGVRMKRDHVYVIPPNKGMAIQDGTLLLSARQSNRPMPIDRFLQSLAQDQQGNAVGVILSGTASDGTHGLQAIKSEGGITFAQDPKSAKYPGMPESAVAAGCVDFVLPPAQIGAQLCRIAQLPQAERAEIIEEPEDPLESTNGLAGVLERLEAATGVDFSLYKPSTIRRRIARRLSLLGIESLDRYAKYLAENGSEVEALYHDILIHVTSFFRETETFVALRKKVFPRLVGTTPREAPIRVWVPGCSTGEEAYSVVIALLEFLKSRGLNTRVLLFGTDISVPAIQKARSGIYPEAALANVSPERLQSFFTKAEGGYQVSKSVRDMCLFARQDLSKDPPFSKLDLICCRNVLIYMGPQLHQRILSTFHYALQPFGFLVLGKTESLGPSARFFTAEDSACRIYSRNPSVSPPHVAFAREARPGPIGAGPAKQVESKAGEEFSQVVERILLERYAPAAFVVDSDLQVLHFQGNTGPYLAPVAGTATLQLLKLVRKELVLDIRTAFHRARKEGKPARKEGIHLFQNRQTRTIDLEVIPIQRGRGVQRNFAILITEAAHRDRPQARGTGRARDVRLLTHELSATREHLQSIIAGQEAVNEEVRAANEEALSANEELQSTNEELETAKEELQSSNEELTTLNEELQNRNAELGQMSDDLSLLVGVNIPIVILGSDRRIRRFTPSAGEVLNLIPADIGRPIGDIKPKVEVPGLDAMIEDAIAKGSPVEKDVQDQLGHWYSLRIRPYTNAEDKTGGVLVALMDIDVMKRSLDQVRQSEREAIADRDFSTSLLDMSGAAVVIRDADGNVIGFNRAAQELSGYSFEEIKGKPVWSLLTPPEQVEEAKATFASVRAGAVARDYESTWIRKDGSRCTMVWSSVAHRNPDGSVKSVVSTGLDITARKQAEDRLRASEERHASLSETLRRSNAELRRANEDLSQFAYSASHDLQEPLRMVAIYAQVLERKYRGRLDSDADQYLAYTMQGAKRMERMVKSLLEYAQAVNTPEGEVEPLDAGAVLRKALANLSAAIEESGALVSYDRLPTLAVQETHLLQLFQNILGNAIKYRGEAPPRIQIGADKNGIECTIWVKDNGIGIHPKYAERIFGMFRRLNARADYGGSGLGLAICKRIVERYGGRIWVESEEGKGATFYFALPAKREDHDATTSTTTTNV